VGPHQKLRTYAAILCILALPGPSSRAIAAKAVPLDQKTIVHVLNRIGFGPGSGDVARVADMGLERFIEEQLHPERIDDGALTARLVDLTTVRMSSREISQQFEVPIMEARRERRRAEAAAGNGRAGDSNDTQKPVDAAQQQQSNRVVVELSEQKVLRAIYSQRQLQEVLTDFWFNHFNVDARKGPVRFMLTEYEREAIRPHVLGKFRDLLEATAKSPAMLFYLDNWMSADPNGPHPDMGSARNPFGGRRPMPPAPRPQNANAPRGLNENYGRELMELHTLGVDGGYTQRDVTEVARAFTGWTIERPRQGGGYRFEARLHDPGKKVVLGHTIDAGGERDGEQVLDLLAKHPATARFVATKLVRRFVSDAPPASLVDRAAARFQKTDGDLREVMRTILTSPEFLGPEAYRAKVKTPFEFVVSAARTSSADIDDARLLVRTIQQLGMPLYQCQPPTGYKDTADAWVNTGALVGRMNFALALANGRMAPHVPADPQALADMLLGGDVSASTQATITKAGNPSQMIALTLGSPEFQRR
jgi:uncharacterized protein (DUF1800 family)